MMKKYVLSLFNLLYPNYCLFDRERIKYNAEFPLCEVCLDNINFINSPVCLKCGRPMYKIREKRNSTTLRFICRKCSKDKNWFGLMRSVCFYEGVIKKCVHLFKYKKTIKLRKFFNSILLNGFKLHLNKNYDLIVAVPMSPFKKFFREFNHADILAHDLSLKLGIAYRKDTLRRTRFNKSQTRLNSTQRKKNVKGSFGLLRIDEIQKKKILLIDDVATTLSTVNECAKTLMQGGAKSVDVFTLARG